MRNAGFDLALNAEEGVPDWVQLMPPGVAIKGHDGRSWELTNPAAVVRAFQEKGVDLPIDYEHQEDDPARRGNGPIPAAGWIKEVRYDPARGLLARVEWTATARRMIEAREYRYLSPVFNHTRAGVILTIQGASLVHRPNLQLKALAREEAPTMPNSALSKIAAALGLDGTADEAAILTAINREKVPDPARFVPIEAVRELVAERAQVRALASEQTAVARVEQATNAGYLTPAMRDWAVALCRDDPASFDSFLRSAVPVHASLFTKQKFPALNAEGRLSATSAEEASVFEQLGLSPDGKA